MPRICPRRIIEVEFIEHLAKENLVGDKAIDLWKAIDQDAADHREGKTRITFDDFIQSLDEDDDSDYEEDQSHDQKMHPKLYTFGEWEEILARKSGKKGKRKWRNNFPRPHGLNRSSGAPAHKGAATDDNNDNVDGDEVEPQIFDDNYDPLLSGDMDVTQYQAQHVGPQQYQGFNEDIQEPDEELLQEIHAVEDIEMRKSHVDH